MMIPRSIGARRVLMDSGAYYALADERALEHERAIRVRAELVSQRRQLYTTNFVLAETHALILNRRGRDAAAGIMRGIAESHTIYVRVKRADELRAIEIISTHDDKDYSFTDAASFAVMERFGITTAFTFDRHFAQFGFTVLGLDEP